MLANEANNLGVVCINGHKGYWTPTITHGCESSRCGLCHDMACWKRHLSKSYNITPEDWFTKYNQQDGKCLCCGEERKLEVDHNHTTNQVRGLICRSCNTLVGYIESGALHLALDYLNRFNSSGNRT